MIKNIITIILVATTSISCMNKKNITSEPVYQLQQNLEDSTTQFVGVNEQLITLGETRFFETEGINISFDEIIKDSRCPREARCITAGVYQAKITLTGIHSRPQTVILTLGESNDKTDLKHTVYQNHTIELYNAYPIKSVRKSSKPSQIGIVIKKNEVSK